MTLGPLDEIKRRMEDGAARQRLLFAFVSDILAPSARLNIRSGGRPPFAPLSPVTLAAKRRKGQPLTAGIATGKMYASLTPGGAGNVTRVTEDSVEYGSSLPQAAWFQEGVPQRNQPARPFITAQREDIEKMADRYRLYLLTGRTA